MGAAAKQGRLSGEAGALTARRYAEHLLRETGARAPRPLVLEDEHPALAWARSGLMALTGARGGEPQMCPAPLAACADGALAALASLAPRGAFDGLRGSQLLAERAAITGHTRNGSISPGGSCRLLEAADGSIALNLAREADWSLLPAWLEGDARDWAGVIDAVRARSAQELVARGREIGLAVARNESPEFGEFGDIEFGDRPLIFGQPGKIKGLSPNRVDDPLVVDLSSLWAGPLCGHLLQRAGARVVKVESARRPDGARQGPAAFYDLLNAGKASVALDFGSHEGVRQLRELLAGADIVIEGSRPRALRQLGIEPAELLAANPRLVWVSITAYGRTAATENWIGYGDDAGVAAGLSAVMRAATGQALIVGDAIADPLTGLHAAVAAWARHRSRMGGLVALALRDVVAHCIGFDAPEAWRERAASWSALLARSGVAPARPLPRASSGLARPLGADTGILGSNRARPAPALGGAR